MNKAATSFDINKYPKKLGGDIAMFKASHFVDVFFGEGWTTHARFSTNRTKTGIFVKQVSGDRVPPHVFKFVIAEVNK